MKLCVLGGSSSYTPVMIHALADCRLEDLDEISLCGVREGPLGLVGAACARLVAEGRLMSKLTWTIAPAAALEGADIVLNQMRVGGEKGRAEDRHRLAASGVVGHAASYAEALRIIPALEQIVPHLRARCPCALFVDFSNPVSAVCEYLASETDLQLAGLCHHTTLMRNDFAAYLDVEERSLHLESSGINHLSFVTNVVAGGRSLFSSLVRKIIETNNKAYNYSEIQSTGAIPIGHAFSLLHPGEVWYVRQEGIRQSLSAALLKITGIDLAGSAGEGHSRDQLLSKLSRGDLSCLPILESRAPWYKETIVPFLQTYTEGPEREFVLTVRAGTGKSRFGGRTEETACRVGQRSISPLFSSASLPLRLHRRLESAVRSESKLLEAISGRSFEAAVEALGLHPNVRSPRHARKFLRQYFPLGEMT